jgi:hypothetical protein
MNLNPTQIQHIHSFVKRKYVDYYDVQIELVDHIATAIEEKVELNPKLDFYTALQEIYNSFGLFGFIEFVEEKEKQVQRRFRKMHCKERLSFFTVPKVIFTFTLVFLSYQINIYFNPDILKYSFAVIFIGFMVTQITYLFYQQKKQSEKLISCNSPFKMSNLFILVMQFTHLNFYDSLIEHYPFVVSIIIALVIVGYAAEVKAMVNINYEQRRLYPEAFA